MWSPLDPNCIITGSADFTVRIWRVNCNDAVLPPETADKKSSKKNKKKQNRGNKVTDVSAENTVTDLTNTISECSISDAIQSMKMKFMNLLSVQRCHNRNTELSLIIDFRGKTDVNERSEKEENRSNNIFCEKYENER